jgi:hypothetical protein
VHDLRRTSATLAGECGCSPAGIAKALNHTVTKDRDGHVVAPRVTRIYDRSERKSEKRAVLDSVAAHILRVIDAPVAALRLAA